MRLLPKVCRLYHLLDARSKIEMRSSSHDKTPANAFVDNAIFVYPTAKFCSFALNRLRNASAWSTPLCNALYIGV